MPIQLKITPVYQHRPFRPGCKRSINRSSHGYIIMRRANWGDCTWRQLRQEYRERRFTP